MLSLTGQSMKVEIEVAMDGKPMPNVHYLRAGRELREDSRISISTDKSSGKSRLEIKKTRLTDEAKYTVNLEQDGVITDMATFSVFIKGQCWCWWCAVGRVSLTVTGYWCRSPLVSSLEMLAVCRLVC